MTKEGDVGWVAPEKGDILLDPVEGRYLVHEAIVGYAGFEVRGRIGVQETWKKTIC